MRKLKFTTKPLFLTMCLLVSVIFCGCSQRLDHPKYKIGEVVYLKPDSLKAIIINDGDRFGEYELDYGIDKNSSWWRQFCAETDIYGAEHNKK